MLVNPNTSLTHLANSEVQLELKQEGQLISGSHDSPQMMLFRNILNALFINVVIFKTVMERL